MGNDPAGWPFTVAHPSRESIDLAGWWDFRTDPKNEGEKEGWAGPGGEGWRKLLAPLPWERQGILEDIEEHIAVGDYYRARAGINFALVYLEDGNIFSFSDEDRALLEHRLATVEREIEINERAAREAVEAAADDDGD